MKRNFLLGGWRGQAGAVMLMAVVVGTMLRFFHLGSRELSIDESLSWAESSAPNVAEVLRVQHQLDSGKFPIYELAQHGWMRAFGESEAAMRALSALIGSISIVLVFILGVEVMLAVMPPRSEETTEGRNYTIAALCALLFAVALPSVDIARQARMYSMMQAWILAQVIFLLRTRRLGGLANYAGITIFSAIAVATNFTAVLVIAAEALWLIHLYSTDPGTDARSGEGVRRASPWLMGFALLAAMALLLPFFAGLRYGVEGVQRGDYGWIKPPGPWEPLATFESGLGTWPFPLFTLFAILGAVRLWRSHRAEAELLILWIAIPPLVLFAGSYLVTPMLVTRYLISSFVPLYILTAIGIEYLPSPNYRAVAIVAIVSLSILRVSSILRAGDNRWRDACEIALSKAGPDGRVGVSHEYYLVSYYMPVERREQLVRVPFNGTEKEAPRVVIISETLAPAQVTEVRRAYPVVVARFKNVTVVSRLQAGMQILPGS